MASEPRFIFQHVGMALTFTRLMAHMSLTLVRSTTGSAHQAILTNCHISSSKLYIVSTLFRVILYVLFLLSAFCYDRYLKKSMSDC